MKAKHRSASGAGTARFTVMNALFKVKAKHRSASGAETARFTVKALR
ncbi:MAG: hypothetical protein LBT01_04140 [Spirochaetaceae bacterium]|nr:hypothetical protein [Spirochaetaceae bacterium]